MNVSVVIPLYNKVRHIRRAIESVMAQARGDFELIVVDDGSTDGSGDVVRTIADPRIRLIVQKNAGECAARNRGIQEAACELVAFLDADDEWLPGFLATVLDLRDRYPDAGLYATAYRCSQGEKSWRPLFADCVVDAQGGLLEDYFQAALGPAPVTSSSVMIPRRVFLHAGTFPVGVSRGGDLQTWARIALRYRVAWSPVDGAVYHLEAENRACRSTALAPDVASARAIEDYFAAGQSSVAPRRSVEDYLASRRLMHARSCYMEGNKELALQLLEKVGGSLRYRWEKSVLNCVMQLHPGVVRQGLRVRSAIADWRNHARSG